MADTESKGQSSPNNPNLDSATHFRNSLDTLPFSLQDEISHLWQYRKWLITIVGLVSIASIIYAYVTPAEYLSTSELSPPSFKHLKSLNFNKNSYQGFGAALDEDLERAAAALKSDSAFQYMVRKFNLTAHYGCDDISSLAERAKVLREKYDSKISVKVSGLSTVQINVFDEDPQTAANIANEFLVYADLFVESIARRKEGLAELRKSLIQFKKNLKEIQDTTAHYRSKFRMYHLDNMSETISAQLNQSFSNPEFAAHYDKLLSAEHRMRFVDDNIISTQNEINFRIENLNTYPTLIDTVSKAYPSLVRARPKRMPIVLLSAFFAFLITTFAIVYFAPRKK